MTWAITDRVTRINFYAALALAGLAMLPLLLNQVSLIMMAAVLMLVYQAWRLAMSRQVHVRIDPTGVTKTIGTRTWRLDWGQVRAAQLTGFVGSTQLILTSEAESSWNSSDKLYYRLGRDQVAVQVPVALLPQLRELLAQRGVQIQQG